PSVGGGRRPAAPRIRTEGSEHVVTTALETEPEAPEPVPEEDEPAPRAARAVVLAVLRLLGALVVPIAAFAGLWLTFDWLRDADVNRFVLVAVAIAVGVGGVFILYWAMNRTVDHLPERFREGVRPYVFVGPALVI